MNKIFFFLLCLLSFSKAKAQQNNYYPIAGQWDVKSPAIFGIDSNKIQEAISFAIANETKAPRNLRLSQAIQFGKEPFSDPIGPMSERGDATGVIIYKGYIIASWGNPNAVEMVHSVTKSMVSTVVGLAVEKGLIHSVNDLVYPYLPPIQVFNANAEMNQISVIDKKSFIYPFETTHNKKITWDHLLRQTSDWEGELWGKPDWADRPTDKPNEWLTRKRNEPGTTYKYNDTRVNALALAATTVWHKPLPEVLREQIMNPIGASNSWLWAGYQNAWIVLDGKLIQSVTGGGHFGGGIFMNAYDLGRFGLLTLRNGNWNGKQLISKDWIQKSRTPTKANEQYGFMNYFLNTNKKLYPSAPETAFAHIGNGTNMIYVDSENDIVAVVRWIENDAIDGFLKKLLSAIPPKK
jgi:CubicO group peptidase (beta-lactamase class C family)